MDPAQITLVGNLGREPDLRFTAQGTAVADCLVIVNRRVKRGDQWEDGEAEFWNVTVWRDQAEHVAESLHKGDRVIVVGQAKKESYEAKDGTQRTEVKVEAEEIAPSLRWATCSTTRASGGRRVQQTPDAPTGRGEDVPF